MTASHYICPSCSISLGGLNSASERPHTRTHTREQSGAAAPVAPTEALDLVARARCNPIQARKSQGVCYTYSERAGKRTNELTRKSKRLAEVQKTLNPGGQLAPPPLLSCATLSVRSFVRPSVCPCVCVCVWAEKAGGLEEVGATTRRRRR